MPEHPRRNPVRRAQESRAAVDHASLQDIRDQLPPAPEARAAAPTGAVLPSTVPPALLALVEEHARHVNKYWSRAMQAGRQYHDCQGEWQRLAPCEDRQGRAGSHSRNVSLRGFFGRSPRVQVNRPPTTRLSCPIHPLAILLHQPHRKRVDHHGCIHRECEDRRCEDVTCTGD